MSVLRHPQLRLLADGVPVPGVIDAEITSNNHFAADHYSARIALTADPVGLGGWATRTDSLVELQVGLDGGFASLITGRIDCLIADPIDNILRIEGRDLSAGLIEARTHESFANQTASDIATLLATRQGLAASVTSTSEITGRYYSDDHTGLTLDGLARASTEWDLLCQLAQREGYDVFVSGTTLYFQPQAMDAAPAMVLQPVAGAYGPANVLALRLQRSMTLSGGMAVTVKSWNSQHQAAFSQTATRGDGSRLYAYVRPNLTPDEALALAQRKLAAITAHEFQLTATMPGELSLAPRATVQLAGTGSAFDQAYVIDEITRSVSARTGFTQTLRAHTAAEDF